MRSMAGNYGQLEASCSLYKASEVDGSTKDGDYVVYYKTRLKTISYFTGQLYQSIGTRWPPAVCWALDQQRRTPMALRACVRTPIPRGMRGGR